MELNVIYWMKMLYIVVNSAIIYVMGLQERSVI